MSGQYGARAAHRRAAQARADAPRCYDSLGCGGSTRKRAAKLRRHSALARAVPDIVLFALCELLLGYQLAYLFDDSRRKAWVASRQIGKSFTIAWEAVLRAGVEGKRDQILLSASQDQAEELLRKCFHHCEFLHRLTGVDILDPRAQPTKSELTFRNGSRVKSRATSSRSTRGFTGDVLWDETAITQHDRQFYESLYPIATRGAYRLSSASTPWGDSGVFFDMVEGDLSNAYSVHRTTIHDAVAQGLYLPGGIEELRAGIVYEDSWLQEFCCQFLSDAKAFFPRELLKRAIAIGVNLSERPVEDIVSTACGIDVGRKRDLSSMAWVHKFADSKMLADKVDTRAKMAFDEQHRWMVGEIKVRRPSSVYIDATGLGMERAESLEMVFPGTVTSVEFSRANVKRQLAENLRGLLERGQFGIDPADRDTLAELALIRKRITADGRITYVVDDENDRANDGHADRATGLMLAALAASDHAKWYFETVDVNAEDAVRMHAEAVEQRAADAVRVTEAAVKRVAKATGAKKGPKSNSHGSAPVEVRAPRRPKVDGVEAILNEIARYSTAGSDLMDHEDDTFTESGQWEDVF